MSWSKKDAALSFVAHFAHLSDEDILGGQPDFEYFSGLREEAKGILELHDQ